MWLVMLHGNGSACLATIGVASLASPNNLPIVRSGLFIMTLGFTSSPATYEAQLTALTLFIFTPNLWSYLAILFIVLLAVSLQ